MRDISDITFSGSIFIDVFGIYLKGRKYVRSFFEKRRKILWSSKQISWSSFKNDLLNRDLSAKTVVKENNN
jgi:hypothetical protein